MLAESNRIAGLAKEQALVQAGKTRTRIVSGYDGYDGYIFPPQVPNGTDVTRFLQEIAPGATSLELLLQGMYRQREQAGLHWVDMGGGYGGAQRELHYRGTLGFAARTCVDVLPPDATPISDFVRKDHARTVPGFDIRDARHAPTYLQADIATVQLPCPADIITAVQSFMYLPHPLQALANWYNQLAPGGVALIATDHQWSEIMYGQHWPDTAVLSDVSECFDGAGIPHAFGTRGASGWEYVNTLAMQKVPGTELRSCLPVAAWIDEDGFMAVRYPDLPLAVRPTAD